MLSRQQEGISHHVRSLPLSSRLAASEGPGSSHVGDRCSFEVLLDRIGLNDPALRAIAEIVHDIDLKDGKFGREQVPGIAHVIGGICTSPKDDLARIERGLALFDDTYEYFRKKRGR